MGPVQIALDTPSLVQKIITAVYEDSTYAQFLPCLRVCQTFHYWARQRLYQVLTLTASSLARFLTSDQCESIKPIPVRVLTVQLQLPEGLPGTDGTPAAPADHPNGDQLMKLLAALMGVRMPFIRSFSIRIEDQHHEGMNRSFLRQFPQRICASSITALLSALPPCCGDLEIDTSGFEAYQSVEHICPYIGQLMPQLRHVRIRIGRLCPEALLRAPHLGQSVGYYDISPKPIGRGLRSVVINMELYSGLGGAHHCKGDREGACHEVLLRELSQGDLTSPPNFPGVERLDIYSPMLIGGGIIRAMLHYDVKNSKTRIVSYLWVPGCEPHSQQPLNWRCFQTDNNQYVTAPFSQARELLEDSWRSTVSGTRFAISRVSGKIPEEFSYFFTPVWSIGPYTHLHPVRYFQHQREWRTNDDPVLNYINKLDLQRLQSVTLNGLIDRRDASFLRQCEWILSYHYPALPGMVSSGTRSM